MIGVYTAFYHSSKSTQPIALSDLVTYLWLGQATFVLQPWGVDGDIAGMIRSGNVVYELLRPVDLYSLWYGRALAMRTAPTIVRGVPMFIIAGLFFGMRAPASYVSFAAWALSIVGAVLLSAAFTTLFTIFLLWTISGDGIYRLSFVFVYMFSGMLIPLPLYPNWMQGIINFMPFRGLYDTPSRLYIGHIPPQEVFSVLIQQIAWTLLIVILGRFLLYRATKRLVAQGG